MRLCGFDTGLVKVRYAYTNEGIARAFDDVVSIDPLMSTGRASDPAYQKAVEVLAVHVLPTLTNEQRLRMDRTGELLMPDVQDFIFKHELGHIYYRSTLKRSVLNGFIMAVVTYSALLLARTLLAMVVSPLWLMQK